ncbi:MAG: EAL domain-containing protein, partial [Rhodoferax sp.]|nr:EAL domain-containing protein [Rhodoferax sp.]
RTFAVLLAAALLPLLLFAAVASHAYLSDRDHRQRRAEAEFLKHIGMRSFDRLTAARATLAAYAADGLFDAPALQDPAVKAVLVRVATVGADGATHGELAMAQQWRALPRTAAAPLPALWWTAEQSAQPGRVMLAWPDAGSRGHWLAEVNPAFLFQDFSADGPAATLCLRDAQGRPLRCPQIAAADDPSWHLFLAAGFGSDDWVLHGRHQSPEPALQDGVLRLSLGAGLATPLLVGVLGLMLVRRTLVPLEQLIDGTRRVARGDWQTRVDARRDDEFGHLARLFNAMVARQGRQLQAVTAQAGIDRELLGALDIDKLMQQVLQRLQVLLPQAQLAVLVRRGPEAEAAWQVHRLGQPPVLQSVPLVVAREAAQDGLFVTHDAQRLLPSWIARALPGVADAVTTACWVPALWQTQTVAMMLIGGSTRPALDDDARGEIAALRDRCALAVAAAEREHRLVERAVRDDLTGLFNRHGLHDTCDALLAADPAAQPFALLYLDLDGFKEVNDAMGHSVGDTLLRAVADRMRSVLPPEAVLARPGGDEFVVVLPSGSDALADALAETLCERLAQPFVLRGQVQYIGASVGLASSPVDGTDREELLRRADLAMYAAKGEGRGRWRRYASAMDHEASERAWILRDLRVALDTGGLEVHYQPRLDMCSGRTCGAEALVRWKHPVHGWVSPVRFVPVAEESELIVALGQQVMAMAMVQRRRWRDAGLDVERVAVNVSARQLRDPDFGASVLGMLAHHGLRPQDLEIEITESLFAGDAGLVERALAPLRAAGVQVALDDFGTGFSSLSALRHLPVDVMKIDRSFVIDLGRSSASDAVVRSVIALARDLGKRVVAEGVETALQQQRLIALGCDEVQGYRYAKPLPAEDFAQGAAVGFGALLQAQAVAATGAT